MERIVTRYPKSGKGSKWTVVELRAVPLEWKGDTLSDGSSLSGEVRLSASGDVSISFRYGFKLDGKKAWHYCGMYPTIDMASIRSIRDDAKKLVAGGIDPRSKKKSDRIDAQAAVEAKLADAAKKNAENLSVNDLFATWIEDGVNRSDGNKYITRAFSKHVLPIIGVIPLRELSEHHLRDIYRTIIQNGKQPTAVELSKDVKQMLKWGEQRRPWRALMIDGNPANLVEIDKLLTSDYVKERDRVLSIEEIRKLDSIFKSMTHDYAEADKKYSVERPLKKEIQLAMWLCLGTLCRIGELLMAEWVHVDLVKRTWFIPKENTKGERGKKQDQLVYLSDFTLEKLQQLKTLTGDSIWLFPARYKEGHVCVKSASKQIGDRQVSFKNRTKKLKLRVESDSLVLGGKEWTPHDLRRSGATMMQQLKVPRDVINLCQNHVVGSKVDRHYLHHDFAEEKREAWSKLGSTLYKIIGE
jgi:integrase